MSFSRDDLRTRSGASRFPRGGTGPERPRAQRGRRRRSHRWKRESKVFELLEGGAAGRKPGRRKINVFARWADSRLARRATLVVIAPQSRDGLRFFGRLWLDQSAVRTCDICWAAESVLRSCRLGIELPRDCSIAACAGAFLARSFFRGATSHNSESNSALCARL